jgi:hypothetical protein
MVNRNVQSTLVPAGGSTIVDFKVDVPGTFILVDHSIFRAFNKGALGVIKVEGDGDLLVYSGKQDDSVYLPGAALFKLSRKMLQRRLKPPRLRSEFNLANEFMSKTAWHVIRVTAKV